MIIIIGLGNPGKKYKDTRHNVGSKVIDELEFLNETKFVLIKPKVFMNNSGKAVKKIISNFQFPIFNLWVIHDDIALTVGKIKISKNRGAAGHKGIESIIKELKTKNFVRFRVGIQPKSGKPKSIEKFVLQKFNKEEKKIIKEVIKKTVEAVEITLKQGLEKAMTKFNR